MLKELKIKEGRGAAERGQLISKVQNIVFGGKNINNTVGQVSETEPLLKVETLSLIWWFVGLALAPHANEPPIQPYSADDKSSTVCDKENWRIVVYYRNRCQNEANT